MVAEASRRKHRKLASTHRMHAKSVGGERLDVRASFRCVFNASKTADTVSTRGRFARRSRASMQHLISTILCVEFLTLLINRHMTEVEESLRIATDIIRERLPDVDLLAELARARNGDTADWRDETREIAQDQLPQSARSKRSKVSPSCDFPGQMAYVSQETNDAESNILSLCLESISGQTEKQDGNFSFDIPPTTPIDNPSLSTSDYEWDERQSGAQSCNDGMAALSIQDEQPGYLGLASGAALLRLIQSYTCDPFLSTANFKPAFESIEQSMRAPLAIDLQRDIPKHKIEAYISDYFNTYHISYPLVHQGLFMAQYHEIVPRPTTGWMALMYVVAAIGAFMAATTRNDDDLVLFHCARSHLSIEMLEVGNLTLVQTLSLVSNYLQKRDRPNSSYNYLGLAVRMAFGLGLHKNLSACENDLLNMEIRRRTWWCLFIFDAGSTITFSRPIAISPAGIDARLPLNTFDSYLNASTTTPPGSVAAPTLYTNVRVQAQFHLLTNHLYNRVISKPFPSAKQVIAWDDYYIGKWFDLVPGYYKENVAIPERHVLAHAIMTWRFKHFRMILYRPFLIQMALMAPGKPCNPTPQSRPSNPTGNSGDTSSSVFKEMACDRCLKESHETIVHINQFWQSQARTRMACWYALYFLFSATLVPVISIRNDPQSPLATCWREDIESATETIKSMAELSPFAERCAENLEKLCSGYLTRPPQTYNVSDSETFWMPDPIGDSPISQMLSMYSMIWPEAAQLDPHEQFM
ncbi:hypothetical protein N7447_003500 [Penicillium robsamsonii]|uniref:uncharacterized protein n=1 Tax=Penicillium robsamsonii TaxID=1792511 RepID=UPI0025470A39|nr:uncharacterized protein N7447_003500 [Penicillium robsamsonii]KAJ5826737.1 hypothetical protein N7447_003500 [Penicillium robsamsonii]